MKQIYWAVIGTGGIAARRTLPGVIKESPSARIAGLLDLRAEAASEAAARFGVPRVYSDQNDLLADTEIQAVYIATPVEFHFSQIEAAARAGKHVFVEKPITLTAAEGKRAVEICRETGVLLGVGYMMRFHSLNLAARDIVAKGDLGQVVAGRAQLTCWYPKISGAWRQELKSGGGGALIDMSSHCIDLLEFICGTRVAAVSAMNQTLVQDYQSEDTSTVLLRMESGAQMIVDGLWNVPDAASKGLLEIYGTRGALYGEGTIGQTPDGRITVMLSDQGEYDAQQEREPSTRTFDLKTQPVNMYAAEIEQFSRAILDGGEPAIPGEEGIWNLRVVEACYQSGRERREIGISALRTHDAHIAR